MSQASPAQASVPSHGISPIARLLYVAAKLHSRQLISREEKRLLKQLAIRGDSKLLELETDAPDFLTRLIDLASAKAITAASTTFHDVLYRSCSTSHGKALSKAERKTKGIADNSYVYGEIDFLAFGAIIKEIRPLLKPDGIFVDLGSGTGRACFAMALLSDMRKIVGIEALDDLHAAATEVLEKYDAYVDDDTIVEVEEDESAGATEVSASGSPLQRPVKKKILHSPLTKLERRAKGLTDSRVQLVHGDFTDLACYDWTTADFVFANSTCYSAPLMAELSRLAERLRPGAIVVTLTKSLVSKEFTLLAKNKRLMSWGTASVSIQKRN